MMTRDLPKTDALRRGVAVRTTIHEIMLAKKPALGGILAWDEKDYVLNNLDGTYAAITIDGSNIVGVFFDAASPLNPFSSNADYDREAFLRGMPPHLRSLADTHALRYNRQSYKGGFTALITAAFWNDGDELIGAYSWEEIVLHGAHLVRVELLGDTEAAWREWKEEYQCTPDELAAARARYMRRLSAPPR